MSKVKTALQSIDKAKSFFAANPKLSFAALKRLGYTSLDNLYKGAMDNKLVLGLMALEMGSDGEEIINSLRQTNPDIVAQLEGRLAQMMGPENNIDHDTEISRQIDQVEDDKLIAQVQRFNDECKLIDKACAVVGGWERLMVLRNALSLTDATYRYYLEVRRNQDKY